MWPALHAALLPLAQQYDLLIMPACFGLADDRLYHWLQAQMCIRDRHSAELDRIIPLISAGSFIFIAAP